VRAVVPVIVFVGLEYASRDVTNMDGCTTWTIAGLGSERGICSSSIGGPEEDQGFCAEQGSRNRIALCFSAGTHANAKAPREWPRHCTRRLCRPRQPGGRV